MKKAIILHGMPEAHEYQGNESTQHWIPWLKQKLEERGFTVHTPELPNACEPVYEEWRDVLQSLSPDEDTLLIGHSCGGGCIVRYLSENPVSVGQVILVAPWIDPHMHLLSNFFDFSWSHTIGEKTKGITIFVSLDDGQDVLQSVTTISQRIPGVQLRQFTEKGHFTYEDMGTKEFPELLASIT